MRCIFCKKPSDSCRSREHIIPESLGNTKHVLPPGVVCDSCNQYFAIKIEKPVLDSGYFTHTRFINSIPNKKGRIPTIEILGPNGEEFDFYRTIHSAQGLVPKDQRSEKNFIRHLMAHKKAPVWSKDVRLPDMRLVARLLAKAALEILAARLIAIPGWESQVIDRVEFDEIRAHARYGTAPVWPFYQRRIYPAGLRRFAPDGSSHETMNEFDLLYTQEQELFVIICILGMEFTLNYGDRDLDGYVRWLEKNAYASPLYPDGDPQGAGPLDDHGPARGPA